MVGMRIGLPTLLFLIFLILKLTDKIDWSWFWVCSPLVIGAGIWVVAMAFFLLIGLVMVAKE